MESDDVDKIDGGGEISWRRTFWSSAEEAFNNQLIGLVKKFDVRFGLEFSTVWASLCDLS